MKVYVLSEEVDIVGVFTTEHEAIITAKALGLRNWDVEEFTLRGYKP
jgi:hypothetical protein